MMQLRQIKSPAKLNLFLHVVGQRADNYHLLQSAFMLLDWCDTLHFELRHDGVISRTDLTTALPANDLCIQAAKLLQHYSNCKLGVNIQIDKQIPSQAGLGGGSSNAATCLLALRKLWQLPISLAQLQQLGLQLGADVAFFLQPYNAWVEGIGERLTPIELAKTAVLICKPQQGVSTPAIFNHPLLPRNRPLTCIDEFKQNPFYFGRNDLQATAEEINPQITQAIDFLAAYGLDSRMTGSGSAVFSIIDSAEKQLQAEKILAANPDFVIKLCHNIAFHQLLSLMQI